jgi:outer membrane protein TolC
MKKFLIAITLISQFGHAMTLDEYLAQVRKKNRLFTSLDLSIEASNDKRTAGDVVLAPQITAAYSLVTDKSLPSNLGDKRQVTEYSLGVAKRFSTGTTLGLSAKTDQFDNTASGTVAASQYSTGTLGVSLQQSLWKDFFGQATRLRNDREFSVNRLETMSLELKKRSVLIEAESSFWDYEVAMEDYNLKKENLERARKLDRWTIDRVRNGISDRSDLMNVKALATIRELQLQTAADEVKTQEVRLRENLDLAENEPTPNIQASVLEPRPYINELKQQKNVVQIQAYLSYLEAKSKMLISEEVVDSFRPDLSLVGAYNTSAYDPSYSEMTNNISKTDRPKTYIGVNFTWLFDTSAKKAQIASARKDALAAQYTAEKNQIDGRKAWQEHVRKYDVAKENVKTLEKIANYQRERAKAEQDKLSKGRTITANVVNAETDSAEAEVSYLKAKSNIRKLEAATLLFTAVQE